jgi:hypothetical protein
MVEPGKVQGFLAEVAAGFLIRPGALGKNFDGDFPVQMLIPGAIDFSHPAGTDLLQNAIMAQLPANKLPFRNLLALHGGDSFPSPSLVS